MKEWLEVIEFAKYEGVKKWTILKRIKRENYPQDKLKTEPSRGRKGKKTLLHYSLLSPSVRTAYKKRAPEPQAPSTSPAKDADNLHRAGAAGAKQRLATHDYLLTPREFGRLANLSDRHVRRIYSQYAETSDQVVRQDDGSYRLHAHLLPDPALIRFYREHGMALPAYLEQRIVQTLDGCPPEKDREYAWAWLDILVKFEEFRGKLPASTPLSAAVDSFIAGCEPAQVAEFTITKAKLRRLRREYHRYGLQALIPKQRGGRREAAISLAAEAFLKQHYLHQGRPSKALSARITVIKAQEAGWTVPSERTLVRILERIPYAELVLHREGRKALDDKVLPSVLRDYDFLPMDWWVSDHHQIDVQVLVGEEQIFPWLTAWMDMKSRKIVGWAVVVQPNSESISYTLHQAISIHGIPQHVLIDNGKDYRCRKFQGYETCFKVLEKEEKARLRGVYESLGITPHFAIPYNAKSKPIERFFRTFEDQCGCLLSGYRGSTPAEKPEKLILERSRGWLLRLDEIERMIGNWIEGVYHQREHRGKGMNRRSPNQVFEQERVRASHASDEMLSILLLKFADRRTYQRHGVTLFDGWYRVSDAAEHLKLQKRKFWVRYDPDNLSTIRLYNVKDDTYEASASRIAGADFEDESAYKEVKREQKAIKQRLRRHEEDRYSQYPYKITPEERIGLPEEQPQQAVVNARGRDANIVDITAAVKFSQKGGRGGSQTAPAVNTPQEEARYQESVKAMRRFLARKTPEQLEAEEDQRKYEEWMKIRRAKRRKETP